MAEKEKVAGMLNPYRVLDLTDEKGLFCGKLLGDLGADVIKIERPGGDSARNIGPFYHDEADQEKSLFWFAFNTSKRGITLNIETDDGQEIFKKLVKTADFVIESFPPGYMDDLGLGYSDLEKLNPGIILVSITPFGQAGPYKNFKAPDIVVWAMSGHMYPWGDADRPPVRISHHSQSSLHGAVEAVGGAMMALCQREQTGEGQQVDVSIRDSIAQSLYGITAAWETTKTIRKREGRLITKNESMPRIWLCKDGEIFWYYISGVMNGRDYSMVKWIDNEGMATDFLKNYDWEAFDMATITPEEVDGIKEPTAKLFMAHTKAEILEGALKYHIPAFPVSTTKDLLESVQLNARGYWVDVEHPELGTTITYPGAFIQTSGGPPRISRRAPLIGEHNEEIYEKELGLSKKELLRLEQAKVI